MLDSILTGIGHEKEKTSTSAAQGNRCLSLLGHDPGLNGRDVVMGRQFSADFKPQR